LWWTLRAEKRGVLGPAEFLCCALVDWGYLA
jgi:hypothetical protein